jgi:hypothetical protein
MRPVESGSGRGTYEIENDHCDADDGGQARAFQPIMRAIDDSVQSTGEAV